MKKKNLLLAGVLLLSACTGHTTSVQKPDEKMMTIGNVTYTKDDVYQIMKKADGSTTTMALTEQKIYDKVIGTDDEIKKKAEERFNTYAEGYEDFDKTLEENGYTKEQYINQILVPSVQSEALIDQYFKDNKKEIQKEYKPSSAIILQCDDEKTAKKALQSLKDGKKQEDVFKEYKSESASFSDQETLITTSSNVPNRLINTLAKQEKTGLVDEVFTYESGTSQNAFVAILVTNNYDDLTEQLKNTLVTNMQFASDCLSFYLKQNNFDIHDQYIFDYMRVDTPEYLVKYPEFSETEE